MKGDRYSIETGSDCWSFGVLVFCSLTGNFPWQLADRSRDPFYAEFCAWRESDQLTCDAVQWRHFDVDAMALFRRLFRSTPAQRSDLDLYEAAGVKSFMRDDRGVAPAITTTTTTPAIATTFDPTHAIAAITATRATTSASAPTTLDAHNVKNTVSSKWKTKRLTKWLQSL